MPLFLGESDIDLVLELDEDICFLESSHEEEEEEEEEEEAVVVMDLVVDSVVAGRAPCSNEILSTRVVF